MTIRWHTASDSQSSLILNYSSTPSCALLLDIAAPVSGLRNSHSIQWTARSNVEGVSSHNWQSYVEPLTDATSNWLLRCNESTLGASYVTALTVGQTGLVTLNVGTSPGTALLLDIAALTGAGTRNSHALQFTGRTYDAYGAHNLDWTESVVVASAGDVCSSDYVWQARIGANTFATMMTLSGPNSSGDRGGILTLTGTNFSARTALYLNVAAPAASGVEALSNSPKIDLCGRMHGVDDVAHYGDWTMQALPTTGQAGKATLLFSLSVDDEAVGTKSVEFGYAGGLGVFGHAAPISQPAAPSGDDAAKVASIIAILQGVGLCAT